MIQDIKSARIYASALFSTASTLGELELIRDFLAVVSNLNNMFSNDALRKISSLEFNENILPLISTNFPKIIHQRAINFLKIIFANKKLRLLPEIEKAFAQEMLRKRGKTLISIATARSWSSTEKEKTEKNLERIFGHVEMSWHLDLSLLTGMKIGCKDWIIDLSGSHQLALLRKKFANL